MTPALLDILLLSVLAGISAYRITHLVVSDAILRPWRERHGIAVEGYRGADGTWYTTYTDAQACTPEFKTQKGYEDAIAQHKSLSWPFLWLRVLFTRAFWLRAFSCEQCASVWVSGAVSLVATVAMTLTTKDVVWIVIYPALALSSAGVASVLLQNR